GGGRQHLLIDPVPARTEELELEHEVERNPLLDRFLERRVEREIELRAHHVAVLVRADFRRFDGDGVRCRRRRRRKEKRQREPRRNDPCREPWSGGAREGKGSNRGGHPGGRGVWRGA